MDHFPWLNFKTKAVLVPGGFKDTTSRLEVTLTQTSVPELPLLVLIYSSIPSREYVILTKGMFFSFSVVSPHTSLFSGTLLCHSSVDKLLVSVSGVIFGLDGRGTRT